MTDTSERVRSEAGTKWVRGYANGRKVVDTRAVQLVWTHLYYPTWFFPVADVDVDFAARVAENLKHGHCLDIRHCPGKGWAMLALVEDATRFGKVHLVV